MLDPPECPALHVGMTTRSDKSFAQPSDIMLPTYPPVCNTRIVTLRALQPTAWYDRLPMSLFHWKRYMAFLKLQTACRMVETKSYQSGVKRSNNDESGQPYAGHQMGEQFIINWHMSDTTTNPGCPRPALHLHPAPREPRARQQAQRKVGREAVISHPGLATFHCDKIDCKQKLTLLGSLTRTYRPSGCFIQRSTIILTIPHPLPSETAI